MIPRRPMPPHGPMVRDNIIEADDDSSRTMDLVEPKNTAEWRAWLEANHTIRREIWLVLTKGRKDSSTLTITDAVDEALCFGWIDSRGKRLDESRYMLRLTPRKDDTHWSQRNLYRARKLIDEGRMTDAGMSRLPIDFNDLIASPTASAEQDLVFPPDLEDALKRELNWDAFSSLPPGKRREFIRWVSSAKRPETRQRRIERTVALIRAGKSLTEDMMSKWSKK